MWTPDDVFMSTRDNPDIEVLLDESTYLFPIALGLAGSRCVCAQFGKHGSEGLSVLNRARRYSLQLPPVNTPHPPSGRVPGGQFRPGAAEALVDPDYFNVDIPLKKYRRSRSETFSASTIITTIRKM